MGERTVYLRSTLGARIRSPLGSFAGNAVRFMEVITWPSFVSDGDNHIITGELFGATQGTGSVRICNRNDCSILNQVQTIVSWSDTSITFTADLDSGALDGTLIYIKVTNDDGATDTVVSTTESISNVLVIESRRYDGTTSGDIPVSSTVMCGSAMDYWCAAIMYGDGTTIFDMANTGYSDSIFFNNTPGFYLIGATSGKVVEFGAKEHIFESTNSGIYISIVSWCSIDGGYTALAQQAVNVVYEESHFSILYSAGTCGVDTYGWTDGEVVNLAVKYPLTISVEGGVAGQTFKPSISASFDAAAYAAEGDISADIEWYEGVTLVNTGGTYSFTTNATETDESLELSAANINGQSRAFIDLYLDFNNQIEYVSSLLYFVRDISITDVFPLFGDESGGQKVWIFGTSFESGTDVTFDGVSATSIVVVNTYWIECIAPAGTGVVDVEVIDANGSASSVAIFEYTTAATMTVTSVSPTTAVITGGDLITITGTGFTTDCEVFLELRFLPYSGKGAGYGPVVSFVYPAVAFTYVSATEIEVEVPDLSTDPGDPYIATVVVRDTVTGVGAFLLDALEITL